MCRYGLLGGEPNHGRYEERAAVASCLGVGVGVGVDVGVGVAVGLEVDVEIAVAVAVGIGVGSGVGVSGALGVGAGVTARVGVGRAPESTGGTVGGADWHAASARSVTASRVSVRKGGLR